MFHRTKKFRAHQTPLVKSPETPPKTPEKGFDHSSAYKMAAVDTEPVPVAPVFDPSNRFSINSVMSYDVGNYEVTLVTAIEEDDEE